MPRKARPSSPTATATAGKLKSQPSTQVRADGRVVVTAVKRKPDSKPRPSRAEPPSALKQLRASCIQLVCPQCGKIYEGDCSYSGVRSNYARHLRTHSGQRPYCCTYCTDSFTTSSNLRRHMRLLHPQLASPPRRPQNSKRNNNSKKEQEEEKERADPALPPPLSLPPCRSEVCAYCGRAFAFRTTCAMHERSCPKRRKQQTDDTNDGQQQQQASSPQKQLHSPQKVSPPLKSKPAPPPPLKVYQCEACEAEVSSATKLRRHKIYYCPFRPNVRPDPLEDTEDVNEEDERAFVSTAAKKVGLHYCENAQISSAEDGEDELQVFRDHPGNDDDDEEKEEDNLYYEHPRRGGFSSTSSMSSDDAEGMDENEKEQLREFLRWRARREGGDDHKEEADEEKATAPFVVGDRKRAREEPTTPNSEDDNKKKEEEEEEEEEEVEDTALLPIENVVVDYKRKNMSHRRQIRILRKRLLAQQRRQMQSSSSSPTLDATAPKPASSLLPPSQTASTTEVCTLPETIRNAATALLASRRKDHNMRVRVGRQALRNLRAAERKRKQEEQEQQAQQGEEGAPSSSLAETTLSPTVSFVVPPTTTAERRHKRALLAEEKRKVQAQYSMDVAAEDTNRRLVHVCPIGSCAEVFSSRRRWLRHVERRHKEEYNKYKNN